MPKAERARTTPTLRINDKTLRRAVRQLSERDRDLARVVEEFGPPQLWSRGSGFHALVQTMLGQQVSLASAKAVYDRLVAASAPQQLTPERFLELDDATLRAAGFSRQKTAYVRDLALAIVEGRLSLDELERMSDEEVTTELTKIKGIGRWTADIYLLMGLGRPDAWPAGDLALAIAAQRVKRLALRPTPQELDELAETWRPLRAVAARILWQFYLNAPK